MTSNSQPWSQDGVFAKIKNYIGQDYLAYTLAALGQFFWPFGFIYSNEHNLSVFETSLARCIATFVICSVIVKLSGLELVYKNTYNFRALLQRTTFVLLESSVYAFAQFYLRQPIVQTIHATGPIFVFLLDYVLHDIRINKQQILGVLLAVFGVLFTVNGDLVVTLLSGEQNTQTQFDNYQTTDQFVQLLICVVFLLTQVGWGYAQTLTKTLKGTNSIQIIMFITFYNFISTGIFYPIFVEKPVDRVIFLESILWAGVPMVLGMLCFITAVTLTRNTGVLTMLLSLSVIFGYFVSIFRYGEQVNPVSTLGTVLIIFGLGKIVFNKEQ